MKLHNFVQLAEEVPCFKFQHPNKGVGSETHNKRHKKVEFKVEQVIYVYGICLFWYIASVSGVVFLRPKLG